MLYLRYALFVTSNDPPDMIQSFLMIGQSNMAGRGFQHEVPLLFDEHIKMLRNGRWHTMMEPINYDRPSAGVGLASSFAAAARLADPAAVIGLIPCADGGTSLDDWAVDGVLFDHAVAQAQLAQRSSRLAGILWHQGESDCFPDKALQYREKFEPIIARLREVLRVPDIPLIVGGLADFLTQGMYGGYFGSYTLVNQALQDIAGSLPDCYFVTASGLEANPDGVHINAAALRIFGLRYFEAFQQGKHIHEALPDEQERLQELYARPLSVREQQMLLEFRFASGALSLEAFQQGMAALK
jgi:hypothetical protein